MKRLTDKKACRCGCGKVFTRKEILAKTHGDKTAFERRTYWENPCRLKHQKKFLHATTTYVIYEKSGGRR